MNPVLSVAQQLLTGCEYLVFPWGRDGGGPSLRAQVLSHVVLCISQSSACPLLGGRACSGPLQAVLLPPDPQDIPEAHGGEQLALSWEGGLRLG